MGWPELSKFMGWPNKIDFKYQFLAIFDYFKADALHCSNQLTHGLG